jgi:hypothetical protein
MGQISVEIYAAPGSLLSGNQQPRFAWSILVALACVPVTAAKFPFALIWAVPLAAFGDCGSKVERFLEPLSA